MILACLSLLPLSGSWLRELWTSRKIHFYKALGWVHFWRSLAGHISSLFMHCNSDHLFAPPSEDPATRSHTVERFTALLRHLDL